MANRLRSFLESIAYAGMRPGGPAGRPETRMRWLGPLRRPVLRFLDGPRPSDPLYLSNRTFGQKMRLAALIAVPVLLLGGLIVVAELRLVSRNAPPPADVSNAEAAAKILPELNKPIVIPGNADLQVTEAVIQKSESPQIVGTLRNSSDQRYARAEVELDLTDEAGSQIGGVTAIVENVRPRASATFRISIKQRNAAFVLVRGVRTDK